MTDDRQAMIAVTPTCVTGQAVVPGTRIMVSIILDALADGMTEAEIIDEYPRSHAKASGRRGLRGRARTRRVSSRRGAVKVALDENLPESAIERVQVVGHDVATARAEGLQGADGPPVPGSDGASRAASCDLDRGWPTSGRIRRGTHAGVLALRLDHQSPRAIRSDTEGIAAIVNLHDLSGCIAVWRNGDLRVRRRDP